MAYEEIPFVRYERVTFQDMMYIQTQFLNCERFRKEDTLPSVGNSIAGDVVFLNSDKMFYGFDGTKWTLIGGIEFPINDSKFIINNSTDNSKQARFDLDSLSSNILRVYELPNKDGIVALLTDIPEITGTVQGAALRYIDNLHASAQNDVVLAMLDSEPYIKIHQSSVHSGDVISYIDSLNINRFKVENDGAITAKKITLYNGISR